MTTVQHLISACIDAPKHERADFIKRKSLLVQIVARARFLRAIKAIGQAVWTPQPNIFTNVLTPNPKEEDNP